MESFEFVDSFQCKCEIEDDVTSLIYIYKENLLSWITDKKTKDDVYFFTHVKELICNLKEKTYLSYKFFSFPFKWNARRFIYVGEVSPRFE